MSLGTRVGLIGAGAIAGSHAEAMAAAGVRCVGVADLRIEAASALASKLGVEAFADFRDLAAKGIDAAIVCTPPNSHESIAVWLMNEGIHVLCEKPIATHRQAAVNMCKAARNAGVVLTMATKFRFVDDVAEALSRMRRGDLGTIELVENTFASRVDMTSRWNSNPAISGGGVWMDNGCHSVDLVRHVLGPVHQVMAVSPIRLQSLVVEDTTHAYLLSEKDTPAHIELTWSYSKEAPYLRIIGSEGEISLGWKESRFARRSGGAPEVFGTGYRKQDAFRRNLENFLAAVRGEKSLVTSLEDALASVEVLEAGYSSMRRQSWAPVDSTLSRLAVVA